jgi:WD40 repeat protein
MMRSRAKWALAVAVVIAAGAAAWGGREVWRERRARVLPVQGYVECVAFSPMGEVAITGDACVALWREDGERPERVFETKLIPEYNRMCTVRFSPSGRSIAAINYGGPVRTWSLDNGRDRVLEIGEGALRDIAITDSGTSVALATARGVEVWTLAREKPVQTAFWKSLGDMHVVAFSSRADLVASWGASDGFGIRSLATGAVVASHGPGTALALEESALWASPENDFLWAHGVERPVHDPDGPIVVEIRREPSDALVVRCELGLRGNARVIPRALAISPSGDLLAVSLARHPPKLLVTGEPTSAEIQVFALPEGKRLATFADEPHNECRALAFSPTRPLLAAAWGDRIHLWPIRR